MSGASPEELASKENDAAATSNTAAPDAAGSAASAPVSKAAAAAKPKPTAARRKPKRKPSTSTSSKGDASWRGSSSSGAAADRPVRKSRRSRRGSPSYNYDYDGGRAAAAAAAAPSASFYLGMVEDGETVEMIERKFAALAELEAKKKEAAAAGDGASDNGNGGAVLSLEEQEQLFKETSTFSVSTLQRNVDPMAAEEDYGWQVPSFDIDDDGDMEAARLYLDDDFWDEMYEEKKASRRKRGGGSKAKRTPREPKPEVKSYVCDRRGHFVTALKRVTQRDEAALKYHRIPARPLPLSWGRIIEPYAPPVDPAAHPPSKFYHVTPDVLSVPVHTHAKASGGDFQGILMNPDWVTDERLDSSLADAEHPNGKWIPNSRRPGQITPEDLPKLAVQHPADMRAGMVFIWVEKQHIARVIDAMEKINFFYVENLCWVQQRSDNSIVREDSPVLKKSKLTMLLLRYGRTDSKGAYHSIKLEIRHQRTCDVVFDFLQRKDGQVKLPQWYIYDMIETLLPEAVYDEAKGRGRLLHLWSEPGVERPGWTHVVERRTDTGNGGAAAE